MQFAQLQRREFITLLGGAAAAGRSRRARSKPTAPTDRHADRATLRPIGKVKPHRGVPRHVAKAGLDRGRNVRIEYRWSAGDVGREKASAAELVRSTPDVIVVAGWTALAELHRLTSTIPIVFAQVGDPVDSGFVASLTRPGGNISGLPELRARHRGQMAGGAQGGRAQHAAGWPCSSVRTRPPMLRYCARPRRSRRRLAVEVSAIEVHADVEIERAIAAFASQPDGGLIVTPHPNTRREPRIDHPIGGAASPAGDLSVPIFRSRGRTDVLRA